MKSFKLESTHHWCENSFLLIETNDDLTSLISVSLTNVLGKKQLFDETGYIDPEKAMIIYGMMNACMSYYEKNEDVVVERNFILNREPIELPIHTKNVNHVKDIHAMNPDKAQSSDVLRRLFRLVYDGKLSSPVNFVDAKTCGCNMGHCRAITDVKVNKVTKLRDLINIEFVDEVPNYPDSVGYCFSKGRLPRMLHKSHSCRSDKIPIKERYPDIDLNIDCYFGFYGR